jgi:hypothetical protein
MLMELWELKVSLKIKKIIYHRRRVVLTKDNQDKHNGRKQNLLLLYKKRDNEALVLPDKFG